MKSCCTKSRYANLLPVAKAAIAVGSTLVPVRSNRSIKRLTMTRTALTRYFLAVLLALLAIAPVGHAHAQSLNPPPPADAKCSTNPNGTLCHFDAIHSGTNVANWNNVVCNGFTISFTFSAATHSDQQYDASGNVTLEARHVIFTGTLSNSTDPAKIVPYDGNFLRTMNYKANNTLSFSGRMTRVGSPGAPVAKNVGLLILNDNLPDGQNVIFAAGQFDVDPALPMNTQPLCAALS